MEASKPTFKSVTLSTSPGALSSGNSGEPSLRGRRPQASGYELSRAARDEEGGAALWDKGGWPGHRRGSLTSLAGRPRGSRASCLDEKTELWVENTTVCGVLADVAAAPSSGRALVHCTASCSTILARSPG